MRKNALVSSFDVGLDASCGSWESQMGQLERDIPRGSVLADMNERRHSSPNTCPKSISRLALLLLGSRGLENLLLTAGKSDCVFGIVSALAC